MLLRLYLPALRFWRAHVEIARPLAAPIVPRSSPPDPSGATPVVCCNPSGVVRTRVDRTVAACCPGEYHWTSLKSFQSWKPLDLYADAEGRYQTSLASREAELKVAAEFPQTGSAVPRRGGSHRRYHARCVLSGFLSTVLATSVFLASTARRAHGFRARRGTNARGAPTSC